MCCDPMGAGGKTQEEEYADIKEWLEEVTGRAVVIKIDVMPWDLQRCDLYIFDYGGMLPGCEDLEHKLLYHVPRGLVAGGSWSCTDPRWDYEDNTAAFLARIKVLYAEWEELNDG